MVRYLCLLYDAEESRFDENAVAEYDAQMAELLTNGQYVIASDLESTGNGALVKVRDGKLTVAGCPPGDVSRKLTGYILIEARDLNDAIRLAARLPPARFGHIEIRPAKPEHTSKGIQT